MKVTLDAKEFGKMLKLAGKYVDKSGILGGQCALSVHDGLFEIIVVAFCDRTTVIRQSTDAGNVYNEDFESVPAENGACVVRIKDFAPLKNAPKGSSVTLHAEGKEVSVTAEGFSFSVQAGDPTEFPMEHATTGEVGETVEIVPADCDCFSYIIPALSDDISRPGFTGAVLRDGAIVATDGHRLHFCPLPALFGAGTLMGIIPPDLLRFIADGHAGTLREYRETKDREEKVKGKTVIVTETHATWHVLEAPGIMFRAKPIVGRFPDFTRVIPNYSADETAEIEAKTLARVVKPLYAGWKINLFLDFADDPTGTALTCHGKPGPKSGTQPPRTSTLRDVKLPHLPVRLNPEYIMDALNGFDGTVKFCCIDCNSPVWIGEQECGGRGALIMPISMNS